MKTKLKETLVSFALDAERNRKVKITSFLIAIIAACLILLFKMPRITAIILLFVCISVIIFWKCLEAIKKNELILDRNKLVNIILSSEDVWFYTFLYFIIYPLLLVINPQINFFTFLILTIGLGIFGIFLSKKVSKYFDNKLKKIEYWK